MLATNKIEVSQYVDFSTFAFSKSLTEFVCAFVCALAISFLSSLGERDLFSNLCVGKLAVCFLTFVLVSSDCISRVLTQTQVVASVAETNGSKTKQVKGVVDKWLEDQTSEGCH